MSAFTPPVVSLDTLYCAQYASSGHINYLRGVNVADATFSIVSTSVQGLYITGIQITGTSVATDGTEISTIQCNVSFGSPSSTGSSGSATFVLRVRRASGVFRYFTIPVEFVGKVSFYPTLISNPSAKTCQANGSFSYHQGDLFNGGFGVFDVSGTHLNIRRISALSFNVWPSLNSGDRVYASLKLWLSNGLGSQTVASSLIVNISGTATTTTVSGTVTTKFGQGILHEIAYSGRVPETLGLTNLPAGLSVLKLGYKYFIAGTPTAITSGAVTATATGSGNSGSISLTVNTDLPVFTTPQAGATIQISRGIPFYLLPTVLTQEGLAYPHTINWSATGLPSGITINSTTGVISGTTTVAAQSFSGTITASAGGGTVSRNVTFSVENFNVLSCTHFNDSTNNMVYDAAYSDRVINMNSSSVIGANAKFGDTCIFIPNDREENYEPSGIKINPSTSGDLSFADKNTVGLDVWIKLVDYPAGESLYDSYPIYWSGGAYDNVFCLYVGTTELTILINGADRLSAQHGLKLNTWHHVAFSRNGTDTNNCKLFVDGLLIGETTYTGTIDPQAEHYIGINGYYFSGERIKSFRNNTTHNAAFRGFMQGLRIIATNSIYGSYYTSSATAFVPTALPIFRGYIGSKKNSFVSSGSAISFIFPGNVGTTGSSPAHTSKRSWLQFPVGDYPSMTTAVTIEGWFRISPYKNYNADRANDGSAILQHYGTNTSTGNSAWKIYVGSDGTLYIYDGGVTRRFSNIKIPAFHEWFFISLTVPTGGVCYLHINGKYMGSDAWTSGGWSPGSTSNFLRLMGDHSTTREYVEMYDYRLSIGTGRYGTTDYTPPSRETMATPDQYTYYLVDGSRDSSGNFIWKRGYISSTQGTLTHTTTSVATNANNYGADVAHGFFKNFTATQFGSTDGIESLIVNFNTFDSDLNPVDLLPADRKSTLEYRFQKCTIVCSTDETKNTSARFGAGSLLLLGNGSNLQIAGTAANSAYNLVLGSNFTLEFWFFVTRPGKNFYFSSEGVYTTQQCIFNAAGSIVLMTNVSASTDTEGTTTELLLYIGNAGNFTVAGGLNGQSLGSITLGKDNATITSGWHHFALIRNGTTFHAFVDGAQKHTYTSSISLVPLGDWVFGTNSTGKDFSGLIDDFRLTTSSSTYNIFGNSIMVPAAEILPKYTPVITPNQTFYCNSYDIFNISPQIKREDTGTFSVELLDADLKNVESNLTLVAEETSPDLTGHFISNLPQTISARYSYNNGTTTVSEIIYFKIKVPFNLLQGPAIEYTGQILNHKNVLYVKAANKLLINARSTFYLYDITANTIKKMGYTELPGRNEVVLNTGVDIEPSYKGVSNSQFAEFSDGFNWAASNSHVYISTRVGAKWESSSKFKLYIANVENLSNSDAFYPAPSSFTINCGDLGNYDPLSDAVYFRDPGTSKNYYFVPNTPSGLDYVELPTIKNTYTSLNPYSISAVVKKQRVPSNTFTFNKDLNHYLCFRDHSTTYLPAGSSGAIDYSNVVSIYLSQPDYWHHLTPVYESFEDDIYGVSNADVNTYGGSYLVLFNDSNHIQNNTNISNVPRPGFDTGHIYAPNEDDSGLAIIASLPFFNPEPNTSSFALPQRYRPLSMNVVRHPDDINKYRLIVLADYGDPTTAAESYDSSSFTGNNVLLQGDLTIGIKKYLSPCPRISEAQQYFYTWSATPKYLFNGTILGFVDINYLQNTFKLTSDGYNWRQTNLPVNNAFRTSGIAGNTILLIPDLPQANLVRSTDNGATWTTIQWSSSPSIPTGTNLLPSDLAGDGNGRWVLGTFQAGSVYFSANNGSSWSILGHFSSEPAAILKVKYLNGRFIVLINASSTRVCHYSTDGVSWSTFTVESMGGQAWRDVTLSGSTYVFFSTTGAILETTNFSTFTQKSSPVMFNQLLIDDDFTWYGFYSNTQGYYYESINNGNNWTIRQYSNPYFGAGALNIPYGGAIKAFKGNIFVFPVNQYYCLVQAKRTHIWHGATLSPVKSLLSTHTPTIGLPLGELSIPPIVLRKNNYTFSPNYEVLIMGNDRGSQILKYFPFGQNTVASFSNRVVFGWNRAFNDGVAFPRTLESSGNVAVGSDGPFSKCLVMQDRSDNNYVTIKRRTTPAGEIIRWGPEPFQNRPFTIEGWFYFSSFGSYWETYELFKATEPIGIDSYEINLFIANPDNNYNNIASAGALFLTVKAKQTGNTSIVNTVYNKAAQTASGSAAAWLNKWTHFALVRSANGHFYTYIDGQLCSIGAYTAPATTNYTFPVSLDIKVGVNCEKVSDIRIVQEELYNTNSFDHKYRAFGGPTAIDYNDLRTNYYTSTDNIKGITFLGDWASRPYLTLPTISNLTTYTNFNNSLTLRSNVSYGVNHLGTLDTDLGTINPELYWLFNKNVVPTIGGTDEESFDGLPITDGMTVTKTYIKYSNFSIPVRFKRTNSYVVIIPKMNNVRNYLSSISFIRDGGQPASQWFGSISGFGESVTGENNPYLVEVYYISYLGGQTPSFTWKKINLNLKFILGISLPAISNKSFSLGTAINEFEIYLQGEIYDWYPSMYAYNLPPGLEAYPIQYEQDGPIVGLAFAGVPEEAGTWYVEIEYCDSDGDCATGGFEIFIDPGFSLGTISPVTANQNQQFLINVPLQVSNTNLIITASLSGFPAGTFTYNQNTKQISGSTNVWGTFNPTITFTANGSTLSTTFSLTIVEFFEIITPQNITLAKMAPMTPIVLRYIGEPTQVDTITADVLPPGLFLVNEGDQQFIEGTPSVVDEWTGTTVTLTVTTFSGIVKTASFNIKVKLNITLDVNGAILSYLLGTTLPGLVLETSGATPCELVTIRDAGDLPAGLTYNETTRTISGTFLQITEDEYYGKRVDIRMWNGDDYTDDYFYFKITLGLTVEDIDDQYFNVGTEITPIPIVISGNFNWTNIEVTGLEGSGLFWDDPSGDQPLIMGVAESSGIHQVLVRVYIYSHYVEKTFRVTIVDAIDFTMPVNPIFPKFITITPLVIVINGNITSLIFANLPPGLVFNSTNMSIQGTPTQTGTYNVTATAYNSSGIVLSKQEVFTVVEGTQDFYVVPNQSFVAQGRWMPGLRASVNDPSILTGWVPPSNSGNYRLPTGITQDPVTGIVRGLATEQGNGQFYLTAQVGEDFEYSALANWIVIFRKIELADIAINVVRGRSTSVQLTYTQDVPTRWVLNSPLPAGLSMTTNVTMDMDTGTISGGLITGITNVPNGVYTVIITAEHELVPAFSATKTYTINVGLNFIELPNFLDLAAPVDQPFLADIPLEGEIPSTWDVVGDSGPFSVSALGEIIGTPLETGTYTFIVIARLGNVESNECEINIDVYSDGGGGGPTDIVPSLSNATIQAKVNVPFTYTLFNNGGVIDDVDYNGGVAGVSLSIVPTGISFSGTVTTIGVYEFEVWAWNDIGYSPTVVVTLVVGDGRPIIPENQSFTFIRNTELTGTDRLQVLGDPPTNISFATLPSGISFNSTSYVFTGTATAAVGETTHNVTALNVSGSTGEIPVKFIIKDAPIVITPNQIFELSESNGSFSRGIATTGGTPTGGTLEFAPAGIQLLFNPTRFSGTTPAVGTYNMLVTLTNFGNTATEFIRLIVTPTLPVITANQTFTGSVGVFAEFTIAFTGGAPTSWGLTTPSQVPSGLTFSLSSGKFTGTPRSTGIYPVAIFAQNSAGTSATVNISITINESIIKPEIPSGQKFDLIAGQQINNFFIQTTGGTPTAWAATGLPQGLSISASTGQISGTLNAAATTTTSSITASNSAGSSTQTVEFIITQPVAVPTITAGQTFTFILNETITTDSRILFTGTGVTLTSQNLPSGVSMDTNTGRLQGRPLIAGVFNATITARNSAGTDTETVSITVTSPTTQIPVLEQNLSPIQLVRNVNMTPYNFINSGGIVTSWAASNLPQGLSFNFSTGTISGRPTLVENKTVTIIASNSAGNATTTLAIDVVSSVTPPVINNQTINAFRGAHFSFQLEATGTVTNWLIDNIPNNSLPQGISLSAVIGTISGIPANTGTFTTTIRVENESGSDTAIITIIVASSALVPVITANQTFIGRKGVNFNYTIGFSNTGGTPTGWRLATAQTLLHPGITLDARNGYLSGIPTAAGNTSSQLIASNSAGDSAPTTINFQITESVNAPNITQGQIFRATLNSPFSRNITFSGNVTEWRIVSGELPTGLTLNGSTGSISGTPTVYSGSRTIRIFAGNQDGSDEENITVAVDEPAIVVSPGQSFNGYALDPFTATVRAQGNPVSWQLTNLPTSLQLSISDTGVISGTPDIAGEYTGVVTATGVSGISGSASIKINILSKVPVITPNQTINLSTANFITYSIAFSSVGGASPTQWAALTPLPQGLTLNATRGIISGTPTQATSTSGVDCEIKVENSYGASSEKIKIIVAAVTSLLKINPEQSLVVNAGAPFEFTPTYVGVPTRWYILDIPVGLSINATTGKISGAISTAGTYRICVYCENARFDASAFINITVN